MKKFINRSLKMAVAVSAIIMASHQSFARSSSGDGVMLSLNPMYSTSSDNESASTEGAITANATQGTTVLLDFNIGYQMGNGLYLGLLYASDSGESKNSSGVTTKATASGYGPSIGYMKNGWFGHFHYILSSEYDSNTSTTAKWTKGTGMQVDVGYMMPVSSVFSLGVEMSYRSLEYGTFKDDTGTDITDNKRKVSDMMPRLRLTFIF